MLARNYSLVRSALRAVRLACSSAWACSLHGGAHPDPPQAVLGQAVRRAPGEAVGDLERGHPRPGSLVLDVDLRQPAWRPDPEVARAAREKGERLVRRQAVLCARTSLYPRSGLNRHRPADVPTHIRPSPSRAMSQTQLAGRPFFSVQAVSSWRSRPIGSGRSRARPPKVPTQTSSPCRGARRRPWRRAAVAGRGAAQALGEQTDQVVAEGDPQHVLAVFEQGVDHAVAKAVLGRRRSARAHLEEVAEAHPGVGADHELPAVVDEEGVDVVLRQAVGAADGASRGCRPRGRQR